MLNGIGYGQEKSQAVIDLKRVVCKHPVVAKKLEKLESKDLMQVEPKIVLKAMDDINRELATLADRYQLNLVLNFDSGSPKESRSSVKSLLRQPVVFQKRLDLSTLVIKNLEAKAEINSKTICSHCGQAIQWKEPLDTTLLNIGERK